MSSVSPVGGSYSANAFQSSRSSGPGKQIEKELTDFLQTKGVSARDQTNIKSDLQDAVQSSLNRGGRPDLSKIQDAIKGVFDKHGIDGNEFLKQLPSGLGRPGPGFGAKGTSGNDTIKTLLEFLTQEAKDSKANAAKKGNGPHSSSDGDNDRDKVKASGADARTGGNLDVQA
jgi:hypothetical protein